MAISGSNVSNFANTTDGRSEGVCALNNASTASVCGKGLVVLFGNETSAITHIQSQSGGFLTAQNDNQFITD